MTNTGNVTLAGPFTVADDKLTVPDAAGPLAPGASVQTSATHTITQADLDAGSLTNTATASTTFGASPVTSNQASATVNATQTAALSLTKSASPTTYDTLGQVITYTYVLKNTGNVTLAGPFTVADDKLTVPDAAGPLAPGASVQTSATHTITQADLDAGSLTNTATGHAVFGNATVTSNQASATVNATQTAALSLTKSASPATYNAVDQTHHLHLHLDQHRQRDPRRPLHRGRRQADRARCRRPPWRPAPRSDLGHPHDHPGRPRRRLADQHRHRPRPPSAPAVTSNQASATVNATQTAALSLTKSASPTTYDTLGQVITYTYVLKNTGNVTLAGPFTVADDKLTVPDAAGPLAPGASVQTSATHTITQADLDAGSLTNTATARPPSAPAGDLQPGLGHGERHSDRGALADQEREPDDLRHTRPGDHLHLRAEEHRQRDPRRPLHRGRRQARPCPMPPAPWRPAPRCRPRPPTRSPRPTSTPAR